MNDGVLLWLRGLSPSGIAAMMTMVTSATWWQTGEATVCALTPQAGEHLSACVDRAITGALIASQKSAAVGLAVGPLAATGDADPTLERCLLYTSPSPRDRTRYRMPSSA